MLKFEGESTDIVELPVIIKDNIVKLIDPDLLQLDEATLRAIAQTMHGQLLHLKVRATYTLLESMICNAKDCFRLTGNSDNLYCKDHSNG